MIVQFILIAVALLIFFRLSGRFIYFIPVGKSYHKVFIRLFPLFELSVWLLFLFFGLRYILQGHFYRETVIAIVFVCIFLVLAYYFVSDFIAGIFVKTDSYLDLNKRIKVSDIEGVISKIGYRCIEVKTEHGEFVKIPFSKMSHAVVTYPGEMKDMFYKHSFSISVPVKQDTDYIAGARNAVLNSSWLIASKEPVVQLVKLNDTECILNIICVALNREHAQKIEMELYQILK